MIRRHSARALVFAVLLHGPAHLGAQSAPAQPFDDYLVNTIRLDKGELADAHSGRAVAKVLPTANSRDVTVFGIIALHTTREEYSAHLANLPAMASPGAASIGVIGDEPAIGDFAAYSVDKGEYRSYRDCHPDDCKFKLPASAMLQFAGGVDWKGPNAQQQLDSLVRAFLQHLAAGYRATGNVALPHYDDTHGTWGRDAFDSLLVQSDLLRDRAPDLRDYLAAYPQHRPPNVRDLLYWSEERMPRLRPTLTIADLFLYTPPHGAPILARKLLYANHYFEGALEVLTVADGPFGAEAPGIYVITERHYRFDNLPVGLFNIRGRVRDKLKSLARDDLERERTAMGRLPP